ncbi:MAG: secretin N-terminal domain-containing protein [Candidatus Saelkia tenebricola]|nr:secretin N-terminal domain-containing protein [Candidatus Saelkia tenebricola]
MKLLFKNIIITSLCLMLSSTGYATLSSKKKISLDFKDASLKDVLKAFSMQSGLNFIAGEKIEDRKITLYMENVAVGNALDTILKSNHLTYEQPDGTNILMIKILNVPAVETVTRIYQLNYANPEEIKTLFENMGQAKQVEEITSEGSTISRSFLQGVLSEYGKIAADKRTNSLIITDIPMQFPMIEETVAKLDEPTPQVMVEAEILEVTTEYMEQIGVDFGDNGFLSFTGAVKNTQFPFYDLDVSGEGTSGTISATTFTAVLDLLKKDTKTKVLARPKILTLSNQTAQINITADTAVATNTQIIDGGDTYEEPERIETGVKLIVTPIINKDGYVTIDVESEVIEPKASKFFTGDTFYVDPQTRSAKATIRVRDGDTLVMGGLIKFDETVIEKKIPVLGDLPFLGQAFKWDYELREDKELIIFITPHIVKDYYYDVTQVSSAIERESSTGDVSKEEAIEKTLKDLN